MGSRGGDAKGRRWSFSKLFLRSGACAGQVQMYICLAVHEEAVLPTFPCKVLLKSLSLPYPQGHSGWSSSIAKLLSYSTGLAQSSRGHRLGSEGALKEDKQNQKWIRNSEVGQGMCPAPR